MSDRGGLATLITGGLAAAIGGVATAAMQLVSRRNEGRAAAAELVSRAAGGLVDRLEKENLELRARIKELEDK